MRKSTKQTINFFVGDLDLQVLPHDVDAERVIIGLVLTDPTIYDMSLKYLNVDGIFYGTWESEIWGLYRKLSQEKKPIDLDNMQALLKSMGRENDAKELEWLFKSSVIYAHKFKTYCLRLNEYWIRRATHRFGWYLNSNALSIDKDPLDLLSKIAEGNAKILSHIQAMKERTMTEAGDSLINEILKMSQGQKMGVPSSVSALDAQIKGYRKTNLIILGASSAEGKSTLAFQDIYFQATKGIPVGVLLLEMTQEQMILLMACSVESIDAERVLDGQLDVSELNRLGGRISYIKTLPIFVDDTAALRLSQVIATLRKWHKQHGIQIGWVDHLHLIVHDNQALGQEERFTNIANELKSVAKDLDIPIVALAQLARKDTKEKTRLHVMTDLKYAGGIEQAADDVLLIYRWEHHGIEKDATGLSTEGRAMIIQAKARMIKPKNIFCRFNGRMFLDNEASHNLLPIENPYGGLPVTQKQIQHYEEAPF